MTDNTEYIHGLAVRFEEEQISNYDRGFELIFKTAKFFWEKGRADGMLEQKVLSNPEIMAAIQEANDHPENRRPRSRRTKPAPVDLPGKPENPLPPSISTVIKDSGAPA